MKTIYDILAQAQALRNETKLDSVSPERLGAIHEETLKYINEYQLLASSPAISKVYSSVAGMQGDAAPKSDLTGRALTRGQLVVIVPASTSDATAGDVYRYDGPSGSTSKWTYVAKIGGVPADAELSETSTNPLRNSVISHHILKLNREVLGESLQEITLSAGVGIGLVKKFPVSIGAGEFEIRLIDNDGVLSVNNISVIFYDFNGNELLSTGAGYNYVTKSINTDAAYFSVYIAASYVAKSGIIKIEFKGDTIKNGVVQDIANLDKRIGLIQEEVRENRVIVTPTIENGKYLSPTGYIADAADSCISDFVSVQDITALRIYNSYLNGNRSIIGYNINKEFVFDFGEYDNGALLTIPSDINYIRVTGKVGIAPTIEYLRVNKIDNEVEHIKSTLIADNPVIDISSFVFGYLYSDGYTIGVSTDYKTSPYIPLVGGTTITVLNICKTKQGIIFFYDSHHKLVSVVPGDELVENIAKASYDVPALASYCRYVVIAKLVDKTSLYYPNYEFFGKGNLEVISAFFRKSYDCISHLFSGVANKPIISIIDDDTIDVDDVNRFVQACESMDIKGTFAVLTEQLLRQEQLLDLLLECERRGYNSVIHSFSQNKAYEDGDLDLAMSDLYRGLQDMQKMGFVDFRHWVSPYGVNNEVMQNLARKAGLDSLVSIGQMRVVGLSPSDTRYNIPRVGWEPTVPVSDIKNLINQCVETNGWLLLGTHIYQWSDMDIQEKFNDVVSYAKEKGCQFMTLGEAIRKRMPAYQFYETF